MTERKSIASYLSIAEKMLLLSLFIGLTLLFLKGSGKLITQISLGGLGIVSFLFAFRLLDIPKKSDDPFGQIELLAWIIVPKVFGIASALSFLGMILYTLQLRHDGHVGALMPGGLSILIGSLVILYASWTDVKHLKVIIPTLLRAIPVMFIDFYIVWQTMKSHG